MTFKTNGSRPHKALALWAVFMALAGTLLPQAAPALLAQQVTPAVAGQPEASDEIVYIDGAEGFIRVIDPTSGNGAPEVKWISPESNFNDFGLADVNADGDMEIIGVKGGAGSGRLIIYDPVASGKTVPGQEINGIPWLTLFTLDTGNKPTLVAGGDFDTGVPGDEFIVGVEVASDPSGDTEKRFKMDIYKSATATPDGTQWTPHIKDRYTEERFTRIAVGDFVPGATDEIGLVDEDLGKVEIYRTDSGWKRVFSAGDTKKAAQDIAMGDFDGSAGDEAAWSRSIENDPGRGTSLFVLDWSSNQIEEDVAEAFDPGFRRLAFADANGSGDDELYMLRNVPDGVDKPRLVSLNDGDDGNHEWSEKLEDNNWRALAGGDVDNDGRDELLLGRQDKIRVYMNPASGPNDRVEYSVSFNRRSLMTGNLDAVGFSAGPVFDADTQSITATTNKGLTAQAVLKLRNSTTQTAINYAISAQNNPAWLNIQQATGTLPADNSFTSIVLDFNAASLSPGTYTTSLSITSSDPVENQPYTVAVTFVVTGALVTVTPAGVLFTDVCSGTAPISQTLTVAVSGTPNTHYTAALAEVPVAAAAAAMSAAATGVIASPVPWLTGSAQSNTTPDTITLTVSRTTALTETLNLSLVLIGDASVGAPPSNVRLLPVVICPASMNMLPAVAR